MRALKSESIVSQEQITRPTLFLDTNALHYMFSYLRYAKILRLPPYENKSWSEVKEILGSKFPEGIVNCILKGAKTLSLLQRQTQEQDAAIYASRFAKSEILCGSLEGLAHARLAREGTIYRMRQRLETLSELVSMYLEATDSENVVREWDEMLSLLEDKDRIIIEFAENDANFRQIADIAEFLQSKVFVDVLDSWMYGCAFAIQADQVITFDGYFRKIINKLANPSGDEDWENLKNEMFDRLQGLFGVVNTEIGISFPYSPKPKKLPKEVPRVWR